MAEKKKNKTHEVLARKYRPQVFADVVAQQHVTQTLANAITSGRIAQAYLFVGPRGVGKTTLARIYAKALNCEKGPAAEPCNACELCTSIAEGRCLDVMEFDAASNTQVDRVREIILDNIGFAPAQARFKVFIIDEVHMLSGSSFNALLKTLEEPPAHVKFVFATTEPQKIPATILSRCQRFDLRRIPTGTIAGQLEKIAKLEKVKLEGEAALAIARGAEGGMRDAESALDQLMAFCGDTITEDDVLSVFGLVAWGNVEAMAAALLKGDVAAVLRQIAELDEAGKDLLRLSVEFLDYFRDLLVVAYTGSLGGGDDVDAARLKRLKELAALTDPGRLGRITELFVELQGQLRYALSRRTLLEVTLVRAARSAVAVTLDEVLATLAEAPGGPVTAIPATVAQATAAPAPAAAAPAAPPVPPRPPVAPARPEPVTRPARTAAPVVAPGEELSVLLGEWPALVEKVGTVNPLIRGALKDAQPVAVEDDHVRLSFDPEFAASLETLNVPRNMRLVQKLVEDILRRPVSLRLVIGEPPPGVTPAPTSAAPASEPDAAATGRKATGRDWRKDDAVRRALDAFNGDIVEVRE
ncbi:MAG TPA: DNA polymerase III subunit gamma/tau [Kiritimatiellia bacterium]|nr:DNA polymerase III subunit gamma/tau [Kiritimatiellia bacterium]